MADVNGLLDALTWPQRQLKETVSGDESVWFEPNGMNPHLYAGLNTAADFVLDPLNVIPAGLFGSLLGKGAKAAGDLKGAVTGAFPNYIPNFYGLTDGAANKLSPVEAVATQALQKATGRDFNEALGMVRKGTGFAETTAKGLSEGVKNVVSPTRRASVREGVNPGAQRWVSEYMENLTPRNKEKAAANINYMNHIRNQSGSNQPLNKTVAEVALRSNLETYTPNQPGTISDWMKKNAGTEASGEAVKLADIDAKTIEDHVNSVWGGSQVAVMKRARSGPGGNHYTDMYAGRNPMGRPVANTVVEQMQKHGDDWAKYMPKKGKNWRLKQVNEDGSVWIQSAGRNVGTAVTEGGVNWVMKIDKDGTMMTVISDKHDFLEKIPAVGKDIARALPNDLIAVTPPMFTNVKNIMRKQAKGLPPAERAVSGVSRKSKPKEATTLTLLEEFVAAKPSEQAVKREKMIQAGMLTGALAAGITPNSNNEGSQ